MEPHKPFCILTSSKYLKVKIDGLPIPKGRLVKGPSFHSGGKGGPRKGGGSREAEKPRSRIPRAKPRSREAEKPNSPSEAEKPRSRIPRAKPRSREAEKPNSPSEAEKPRSREAEFPGRSREAKNADMSEPASVHTLHMSEHVL